MFGDAGDAVSSEVGGAPLKIYSGPERRRQLRLDDPFPARVTGVDADGNAFDVEVMIDNVGAGGFHVRLPRRVERGAKLSTTIRFTTVAVAQSRAKCLAVYGTVRRTDCRTDGTCAVAVEFEHHLFL
jgi:hypothetical protein